MPLVLAGATSGSTTVQATDAVTATITLPAATGTLVCSGTQPAFSAYISSSQTISNNTWTKVTCQSEEFDTASAYDNSTNYRFQPTVAGYYQINASTVFGSVSFVSGNFIISAIYKNGTVIKYGTNALGTNDGSTSSASCLIYLNGSTDYLELYIYQSTGSSQNLNALGVAFTFFQGVLVRAA